MHSNRQLRTWMETSDVNKTFLSRPNTKTLGLKSKTKTNVYISAAYSTPYFFKTKTKTKTF